MTRQSSPTDHRLADELAERGIHAEARQIERWRQAGFFSYKRTFLGKGKGSASSYDTAVVDLAAELAGVVAQRRSLQDAALILHARGRHLNPSLVRRALARHFDHVELDLRAILARREAGVPAGDLLRKSKRGRQIRRSLNDAGRADDAFYDLVTGFLGEGAGWCEVFLSATGFESIVGALLDDETRHDLARLLETLSVPALRRVVNEASEDELRRAAADAQILLPYVAGFVELLSRLAGRKDILPLIGRGPLGVERSIGEWSALSIWSRRQGLELDRGVEQAREFGPAVTAMLQLLRMFSFARGQLFGGDIEAKLAELKTYEREEVIRRTRLFVKEHPESAEAIAQAAASATG